MSSLSLRAAVAVGLVLVALTRSLAAAPCGRPDVDVAFPPNGAVGVPNNAVFSAHYGSPARYDDEAVTLTDSTGQAVALSVTFDEADSLLRVTPEQTLAEGEHRLVWPGLRGVSGDVGRGRTTKFEVQSAPDLAPPTFAGLTGITWDLSRERDPCLDELDDRFVFELQVGAGADDSGTALLSLLVFQTREPGATTPGGPSKLALRAFPERGRVEVRRPATKAGTTCFAAVAQDLLGRPSGGGEREVCIETQQPPFFDGCALPPRRPDPKGGAVLGLLLAVTLERRRRGRSAQPRTA